MKTVPHMLTPRLALRPPEPTRDRVFVAGLLGDPQVRQFLGGAVAADDLEAAIDRNLQVLDGEQMWIVDQEPRKQIGLVSITRHKDGAAFELSYQFTPSAWGQGFAFEALSTVLDRAADHLPRIIAETQLANTASVALLGKLGFAECDQITRYGQTQVLFERRLP